MQNIFLIEDPFSVNYKDDWDDEFTTILEKANNLKIKIIEDDDYVFPYGDDTTLKDIEAMEQAESKKAEVIAVDSYDIFGGRYN